jgi:hypothetical protein
MGNVRGACIFAGRLRDVVPKHQNTAPPVAALTQINARPSRAHDFDQRLGKTA